MPAVEAAARRARVSVAIQLDHGSSLQSAVEAIRLGCNGVMLDASGQALPDNIKATREVVDMAHRCGIPVVGEVGYVAGQEGEGAELHPGETQLTIPSEAMAFVERTGVDFLAVSIGTVQGRVKGRAKLDFQRLKQLRKAVSVPLVIHGGSGLNEEQYRRLTALGVAKIDYFTALSDLAAEAMRARLKGDRSGGFVGLKRDVKDAIRAEAERCLRLWGTAGRAAEVLARCRPMRAVERLFIADFPEMDAVELELKAARASARMAAIPGVREVFLGEAEEAERGRRLCWRMRFAHPVAAGAFLEHPDFQAVRQELLDGTARDRRAYSFVELASAGAGTLGLTAECS